MPEPAKTAAEADDFIPLSALQHFLFCPRQCALIHVEQAWVENVRTAEGRMLHEATSTAGHETRRGIKVATALPLASRRLQVSGIADLVELHNEGGSWRPYPVEYKLGKPKAHRADEVQLCAQATALEEMFGVTISEGALFYGKTRRRLLVPLDDELRALTERIAADTRTLLASGTTPPPVYDKKKCGLCSLIEICRPQRLSRRTSISQWLHRQIEET
jgi:CRISPR-associated exonuclease Cas4